MKNRNYTFLIIPSDSSTTKKIDIGHIAYGRLKKTAIVLSLILAFVIYDYTTMKLDFSNLSSLKRENTAQKIELQRFAAKVGEFETQMAKLNTFDQKLRIIANIEVPNSKVASAGTTSVGMGGASPYDDITGAVSSKRNELNNQISFDLDQLSKEARDQELSFVELQEYLASKSSKLRATPSIKPSNGWFTSKFGKRKSPFTGHMQNHKGMDIANRIGTEIIAPANGVVTKVTTSASFGKNVEINHGYGVVTKYAHLSKFNVKTGQKIKRGELIAFMGNTGRSTGPHLHYEVKINGVHVNPANYILN